MEIIIDGKRVPVPANIGVDPATGAMSALHTHETDGTVHIEADTAGEAFTLGQLFTQWGVKLTPTQIGGVKAKAGEKVTVTFPGENVTEAVAPASRGFPATMWNAMTAAISTVMGLLPHLVHHVSLYAGAVLVTGAVGNVLFGLLGLVFSLPLLRRLYRRSVPGRRRRSRWLCSR